MNALSGAAPPRWCARGTANGVGWAGGASLASMNIFLLVAVQRQEHARLSWKPKQFDRRAFAIRCASRAGHQEQLRARAAEPGIRRLSILLGQSNLILPPRPAFLPSSRISE